MPPLSDYSRTQRLSLFRNIDGLNTKAAPDMVGPGSLIGVDMAKMNRRGALSTVDGWQRQFLTPPNQYSLLLDEGSSISFPNLSRYGENPRFTVEITVMIPKMGDEGGRMYWLNNSEGTGYPIIAISYLASGIIHFRLRNSTVGGTNCDYYSVRAIDSAHQYHIAVSWEVDIATGCKFYITRKGESAVLDVASTTEGHDSMKNSETTLHVGFDSNVDPIYVKEARYWNTIRTAEQIALYANVALDPDEISRSGGDLIHYAPLNESTGTTIADESINNYMAGEHGVLNLREADSLVKGGVRAADTLGTTWFEYGANDSRYSITTDWEFEGSINLNDYDSGVDQVIRERPSSHGYEHKIYIDYATKLLTIRFNLNNSPTFSAVSLAGGVRIVPGKTFHWSFKRNGTSLKCTIIEEGEDAVTTSATIAATANEPGLVNTLVFFALAGATRWLDAVVDELRAWKGASRSDAETVANLGRKLPYNRRTGLVGYINFDGGEQYISGSYRTDGNDYSFKGNSGTISGLYTRATSTIRTIGGNFFRPEGSEDEYVIFAIAETASNGIMLGYKLYRLIDVGMVATNLGYAEPFYYSLLYEDGLIPVFANAPNAFYFSDGVNQNRRFQNDILHLVGIKPPATDILANVDVSGTLPNGTWKFLVTFSDPLNGVESNAGPETTEVTTDSTNHTVYLDNIPLSVTDPLVKKRNLYRAYNSGAGYGAFQFVEELDNHISGYTFDKDENDAVDVTRIAPTDHDIPPRTRFVVYKEGIIYAGGRCLYRAGDISGVTVDEEHPSWLFLSKPYSITDPGAMDYYPADSNYLEFNVGENDEITGAFEHQDVIFACCNNGMYLAQGSYLSDIETDFSISRLHDRAGVGGQGGIVKTDKGVFLLGQNGLFHVWGTTVREIGRTMIEPTLQTYVNASYTDRIVGVWAEPKAEVWFATGPAGTNTALIVIDLSSGSIAFLTRSRSVSALWRKDTNGDVYSGDYTGHVMLDGHGDSAGSPELQNSGTANAGAGSHQANSLKDLGQSMTVNSCAGLPIMVVHANGNVENRTVLSNTATEFTVSSNWTAAIVDGDRYFVAPLDFYFDTPWFAMGMPTHSKRVMWVYLHLNPTVSTYGGVLYVDHYVDFSSSAFATYKVDLIAQKLVRIGITNSKRGNHHRFRIGMKASGLPVDVNGVDIDYTFGRRR